MEEKYNSVNNNFSTKRVQIRDEESYVPTVLHDDLWN